MPVDYPTCVRNRNDGTAVTRHRRGISRDGAGISGRISAVYTDTWRISFYRFCNYHDARPINRRALRRYKDRAADYFCAPGMTTDEKSAVFSLKVEK